MKVVYVAHPLGGGPDRERNRENASKWCAYLAKAYNVAPVADWIVLSGQWSETPESRDLGLRIDVELVKRCDELLLVGGRVSPGMAIEANAAREHGVRVVDLTHLGYEVPAGAAQRMTSPKPMGPIERELRSFERPSFGCWCEPNMSFEAYWVLRGAIENRVGHTEAVINTHTDRWLEDAFSEAIEAAEALSL